MQVFCEVHQLIDQYFDTLYNCDLQMFDEVFHPSAIYVSADQSPMLYKDMQTYRSDISKRVSPASKSETRRDFVDGIEFAGSNTAFARVRCSIGERDFTDFLSIIFSNGRWQIISKVFQITPRKEK